MHSIKPQDVLLLLKLLVTQEATQRDLSTSLFISQTEVSMGLQRLKHSSLLSITGEPIRESCKEFLIHAVKYMFPAERGAFTAGIPTAHGKHDFSYVNHDKSEVYVWAHPEGSTKGISLKPIHPSFPNACQIDERLYTIASYLEMIRVGRARERKIAEEGLARSMKGIF